MVVRLAEMANERERELDQKKWHRIFNISAIKEFLKMRKEGIQSRPAAADTIALTLRFAQCRDHDGGQSPTHRHAHV